MDYLERLGITTLTEEDNNLSLALGGLQKGISPLEMAAAYAAIANDGEYIEPVFYQNIKNHSGETIITSKQDTRRVFSKETAFILKELLTQPVEGSNGTATYCKINGIDVAAKTGTTDSNYDRWLCGFTPYYTGVTWYGYDQNETVNFNKMKSCWFDLGKCNVKNSYWFKNSIFRKAIFCSSCYCLCRDRIKSKNRMY